MLARSVVVVGVCADATLASNAEAAKPAVIYFTNMSFSPGYYCQEKTRHRAGRSNHTHRFSNRQPTIGEFWWNIAALVRARKAVRDV
jgi:hypothetical protein